MSVLPAALFVVGLRAVLVGGGWAGPFDPGAAARGIAETGLADAGRLAVVTLLLALCLHPFQYALTQLLEGYWGTGRLPSRLAETAVLRHRSRVLALERAAQDHREEWIAKAYRSWPASLRRRHRGPAHAAEREQLALLRLEFPEGSVAVRPYLREQAANVARTAYPPDVRRVLPTRLGNALRRHEDRSGRQYGLDAIAVAPHLSLVADPGHYALVNDQRQVLDLAINLCCALAGLAAVTAVLLADDGVWVFVASVPLILAYVAYLGAVAAVGGYGSAVATITDLSRFALYDALRLPPPANAADERETGRLLVQMLNGEEVDTVLVLPNGQAVEAPTSSSATPRRHAGAARALTSWWSHLRGRD